MVNVFYPAFLRRLSQQFSQQRRKLFTRDGAVSSAHTRHHPQHQQQHQQQQHQQSHHQPVHHKCSNCSSNFSTSSQSTYSKRRSWARGLFLVSALIVGGCSAYLWCWPLLLVAHQIPVVDSPEASKNKNRWALLYRRMPFNTLSRLWGNVHQLELPVWMRSPTLRFYSWLYNCNLEEAVHTDLKDYKNLSEFFRRPLKLELRPVDSVHPLTSPADGRVLYLGRVEKGHLEQVKGVTYTLQGFLGPLANKSVASATSSADSSSSSSELDGEGWSSPSTSSDAQQLSDEDFQEALKLKRGQDTHLYHCVIYLAPGDYHRFHSPADWQIQYRRHFSGKLLSVHPRVAKYVHGLFSINERVVYFGEWDKGFFSYTAVGATNVGSIRVFCDPTLRTNQKRTRKALLQAEARTGYQDLARGQPVPVHKGDLFGEFNLGSTLVLIFEAPDDFQFVVGVGEKLKFGQALGR